MTINDWDEVKRLAADFQKAQLSSTLQKLSERNCIEIINRLIKSNLLDIIFTNDGKEYITQQHLAKEIENELFVQGGRVELTELAQIINVNLSQITASVNELQKNNNDLKLILGQLINSTYTNKIVEEINEKLILNGSIDVTELMLQYNLPADVLQSIIEKNLGKKIHGKKDLQNNRVFYTEAFIARNRSKIRGAIFAITKPTPVSAIIGQCSVSGQIFFSILDELQSMKQVPGIATGKQSGNGIYVPHIYSRCRNEWIDDFYKQNGYLEYDAFTRFDISDPVSFMKRHFLNENLIFLDSVAVGSSITDQVTDNIEAALSTAYFVDIYSLLPTVFSLKDVEALLKIVIQTKKFNIHIFCNSVVVPDLYLQKLTKSLENIAEMKAKKSIESGEWQQIVIESKIKTKSTLESNESKSAQRKEERKKKATSGKAGGGAQGRETKTKTTKKKYMQGKCNYDSDEEVAKPINSRSSIQLVSVQDIIHKVQEDENVEVIDGLADAIASYLQPTLNKLAISIADELLKTSEAINVSDIEEKLNVLIMNIKVFQKGIKCLDKIDSSTLTKYLLKTLCTDFFSHLLKLNAQQCTIQVTGNLTNEIQRKILLELPEDLKVPLTNLHKSLSGDSIDEFLGQAESAITASSLLLRKFDKKKEKSLISAHKEALLEELNTTEDPTIALHLVTNVLFTELTQNALYMSGRHVSTILSFLQLHSQNDALATLSKYHEMVINYLKCSDSDEKGILLENMEQELGKIKNIVTNFKQQLNKE